MILAVKQAWLVAVCCALAGCATGMKYSSPVTGFVGVGCDQNVNFDTAVSLEPKKKNKQYYQLSLLVNAQTSCLRSEKGNTPYQLLALPANVGNKVFEIGSAVEPLRVFSPDISTWDGNGMMVRRFAKDQFAFRGGVYSVQMRPVDNEKYIMVKSDPEAVGKYFDSIQTSTSTTTIYTGLGGANWTSGVDQNYTRAFSYEGTIVVQVMDTSKKEK